jgi:uncharacterized FAD-dependent dehydrogenase
MRYIISNIHIALDENEKTVQKRIIQQLCIDADCMQSCICCRRNLDARKRSNIHFVCSYEIELNQPLTHLPDHVRFVEGSIFKPVKPSIFQKKVVQYQKIIVIGAGPAGLFSTLALAEAGCKVTLLERGKQVEARMRDIGRLRSRGELNPESNICFGEGGAGTYSDGKLYTRIKHPFMRWVLATFVRFGASSDILIEAHPHIGTDKLIRIIRNMRQHLLGLGVDYRFETRVDDLIIQDGHVTGVRTATGEEFEAQHIILATGHSARDTFEKLEQHGIHMQAKAFAVGLRAEHPQALINQIQFGNAAGHTRLPAAEYSITHQIKDQYLGRRGVYSFCMCPGGLIVPSPTETGRMAVNGMSNAKRSGAFANSGIVVQITPEDISRHGLAENPLMGIRFQRQLEEATFRAAGNRYAAPAMRLTDFIARKATGSLAPARFKPEFIASNLWEVLPDWVAKPLAEGIRGFGQKMRGYNTAEANLFGSETRTSSPVRITRLQNMQSLNMKGLYPVGEGAGYAGGIVSAAVDGLKAAEAIISKLD